MTAMYDYYRPHSTTLIDGEDENTFGGYGGGAEEAGATLVPVQPCIVLDARNQSKDNAALRMSLWEQSVKRSSYSDEWNRWGEGGDAVKSMWTEIVDLRTQLQQLQTLNGQLTLATTRMQRQKKKQPPHPPPHHHHHQQQQQQQRSSVMTQSSADGDDDDERQRETFELLSKKLSQQNLDLLEYKGKVNRLQKELNEKNVEHENLLRKKSPAIQNSDIDLQLKVKERDAKVRELEVACRKQEQVIGQLEKLLERKNSDFYERRACDMLTEENRRLKSESEKLQRELQEKERRRESMRGKYEEKKKEERMQERIKTLEKQISDNFNKWSREKTDMLMKLREAELGLWSQPINDKVKSYSPFLGPCLVASMDSQRR